MIYLDSMGHLFSDSNIEEIYEFAVIKMKLKPEWNHYSQCFPHFDLITQKKKNEAIKLGAKFLPVGCDDWRTVISGMKITFKDDLPKYLSRGLLGQRFFRVDFQRIII